MVAKRPDMVAKRQYLALKIASGQALNITGLRLEVVSFPGEHTCFGAAFFALCSFAIC